MNWIERNDKVMMNTYGNRTLVLERGEGAYVWDESGRRYLDFLGGIAVNSLGYGHPAVVRAVTEQITRLHHCTNLYYIPKGIELAELLAGASGLENARLFFANSGAEANECALKLCRYYANKTYGDRGGRPDYIVFEGAFHGRTFATLSATHNEKIRGGFEPYFPHFHFAKFNDLNSVKALMNDKIGGVMLEPVQGEGGIKPADREFLRGLRQLCDERDVPLIFDEIQCGIARTGHAFAFQHFGVEPDVVTLAKGLGGGVPIGACLARGKWADVFSPGKHGTTFGGNPLATGAALAVCSVVFEPEFLARIRRVSDIMVKGLWELQGRSSKIEEIRGVGLMLGIALKEPGLEINKRLAEKGLLLNCTANTVLRIVPPLIIEEAQVKEALEILTAELAD